MAALDTAGWDQATLDYYNQLQAYRQGMEAKGFNVYDPNLVYGSFSPTTGFFENYLVDPSLGISVLPSEFMQGENEAYYKSLIGKDPASVYQSVLEFGDDPKFGSLGRVIADPNAQYRLVDVSGGNKVIYSGTGTDALQAIHALTPEYSKDATSQWRIESLGSGSKDWQSTPAFKPDQSSGFGKWLLSVLPMVVIPGLTAPVGLGASAAAQAGVQAGTLAVNPIVSSLASTLGVSTGVAGALIGAAVPAVTGAIAGQPVGSVLLGSALGGAGGYLGGSAKLPSYDSLVGATEQTAGGLSQAAQAAQAAGQGVSDIIVNAPVLQSLATQAGSALSTVGPLTNAALNSGDAATQRAIDQYAGQTSPTLEQQFDATFGTSSTGGGLDAITVSHPSVTGGTSGVGGAAGSTAGALTSSTSTQQQTDTQQPNQNDIVVSAKLGPPPSVVPGLSAINVDTSIPPVTQQLQGQTDTTTEKPEDTSTQDIVVESRPPALDLTGLAPVVTVPPGALSTINDTIPSIPEPETPPKEDIVVEARNEKPITVPPITTGALSDVTSAVDQQIKDATKDTTTTDKDKLTLTDLLKAAIIAEGLINGGGGGGSGTSGTGTAGALNPTFTEKLPTTTFNVNPSPFGSLPAGYSGTAFGRGSLNAAADVPQYGGVLPPGFNPQTFEWLGPQKKAWGGYAEGGVDGPGDGRSDSIPAQLSDGEYVIDAETVALLGNGSSKAGARMLDQFRVNIRKDKGRHLAKGKFSVSAKRPESYLGAR